jgi:dTDP-3,4-didehydro-2,6-dideoxy-alpha-D-glucose 3-reductase
LEVLVYGWSDIAKRRIIPALLRTGAVSAVHVASDFVTDSEASAYGVASVSSSNNAFVRTHRRTGIDVVYVTGDNALHWGRAMSAITRGIPTIVDKPVFTNTDEANSAVRLATTSAVFLDEALVWAHHPQVRLLAERLREHNAKPEHGEVVFTIPGPDRENFRWRRDKGGGALLDMGPYLMSTARVLLGGEPTEVFCRATRASHDSVVQTATVSIQLSNGCTLNGYIGFGRAYLNRITLLGPGLKAQLEPAFSGPTDRPRMVSLEIEGNDVSFLTPASDPFQEYFNHALGEVRAGSVGPSSRVITSIRDLFRVEAATTFVNTLDPTGGHV